MPSLLTLWTLKQPILGHLRDADLWIEEQTAPMNQIETTFLGWFCKHHHPDLCDIAALEIAINKSLQDHFDNNKDKLLASAYTYCDLHDWDGSFLPRATVKMTRPKWMHNGTQWTTRAIGLTSPKKIRSLVRRMVQAVDLLICHGNATFVDISMLFMLQTSSNMNTAKQSSNK